ncbi:hypothetical protein I4U23_029416 [Adineta vaga]|nr:hypothetical protein I4U23_029416 [Adineta vaga]
MANVRKSHDGRKRAKTMMEYMDGDVDINDEDLSQSNVHIGQHIHAQFDISMPIIDETTPNESIIRSNLLIPKVKKRDSERIKLHRRMSDISLNRFPDHLNKTTTGFKGRDHVLRVMKTTTTTATNKPIMESKNPKLIQEMIAKRQEKQISNRPISDFALNYGLIDNNGKKSKSRTTSEFIAEMSHQLESLRPTLTRRQTIDLNSPLLRVVKIKTVCNQLLCYCQYVTNREDVVLFLDPNDQQSKTLEINDEIRIAGESRLDMNLTDLNSVTLGITDIRKELISNRNEQELQMEIIHTYDFNCSCNKCNSNQNLISSFDLQSSFPNDNNQQQMISSVEQVYESFTLALMTKRKFDLYGTIIIFESDEINNKYIFVVRDGIGNCLQIIFSDIREISIEIQTRKYVFYQIEFVERIESPREANRWPYEDYPPPKKLFCFRSTSNQIIYRYQEHPTMSRKPENNSRSTQNSRIVRVRDLPIYYDPKTDDIHRYVPRIDNDSQKKINHTNWFQSSINQTRQSMQQIWNDKKDLRSRISHNLQKSETHAKATIDYIRNAESFLPKASVVTVAGLGGLLLGHKGGALRKTFYSSVAVAVALSACYIKQSVNLLDQVHHRIKNDSQKLILNKNNQLVEIESKDRILHTIKNENEPIISVNGDYGQGTPVDQHLYTTRSIVNSSVVDTEKKL